MKAHSALLVLALATSILSIQGKTKQDPWWKYDPYMRFGIDSPSVHCSSPMGCSLGNGDSAALFKRSSQPSVKLVDQQAKRDEFYRITKRFPGYYDPDNRVHRESGPEYLWI